MVGESSRESVAFKWQVLYAGEDRSLIRGKIAGDTNAAVERW